jgi:hypothetical protein
MRIFHIRRVMAAIVAFAACTGAHAWGHDGHQTVGKLADELIAGTHAEQQVKAILHTSLEQASIWADCAKGVKRNAAGKFVYEGAGTYPECKPLETKSEEARMIAFVKRNSTNCKLAPGDETCHKQYHYTDVAVQHDHYATGLVGTSDHDVVAAISAAIVVLQGGKSPAPFRVASKREALLILSHYVGDIHQPLHVTAVYLDQQGQEVDPDAGTYDPATKTIGGNSLLDHSQPLHHEWDDVADALKPDQLGVSGVDEARAVAPTPGALLTWSTQWASDTIQSSGPAFANVAFSAEDAHKHWAVSLPGNYSADREALQRLQLLKGGARLAALLQAIWP